MPPVLPSSLILRLILNHCAARTALNAQLRPLSVKTLLPRKGGRTRCLSRSSRRTLFELDPGRGVCPLPSDLLLEQLDLPQEEEPFTDITTSEDLIAALGVIGLGYKTDPRYNWNLINLSYVRNVVDTYEDFRKAGIEARENEEKAKISRSERADLMSIKSLLIYYLRHVDPILKYLKRSKRGILADLQLDDALLKFLDRETAYFLKFTGRDVTDLMNFAWILTSETTEGAANRLSTLVAHQGPFSSRGHTVPLFVFSLLLRRRNLSAGALRTLVAFAWTFMENSKTRFEISRLAMEKLGTEKPPVARILNGNKRGMMERHFIVILIRLLRSARKVLPAAYDSIAALAVKYLDGLNFRKSISQTTPLTSDDTARLSFIYNVLLKMISLPTSIGPFQSAFHQQQAQFRLLRRMDQFKPPLVIGRQGYRAVISVQLRHKKTLREREWAMMKAKSWPPWKEEKLGIDADIGVENGISRANSALRRSWEAGYAADKWASAASILSGWDTDGSPTVQTRAIHISKIHVSYPRHCHNSGLWASRLRATRTLDEAWSCFLSFQDHELSFEDSERRSEGTSMVYREMFKKIGLDARRVPSKYADSTSTDSSDERQPLPGDGVEVVAAPESPRDAIYVRVPPPTLDEFFEMMIRKKIRVNSTFVRTMLEFATTLETGLQYLRASNIPAAEVRVLFESKQPMTSDDQATLERIEPTLFASCTRLFTRLSRKTSRRSLLFKAITLTLSRKPLWRPAWYVVLEALAQGNVVIDEVLGRVDQISQDLKSWEMICILLDEMRNIDLALDLAGFNIICTGLEKAIFASARRSSSLRKLKERKATGHSMYTSLVLTNGVLLLKAIFKDIVRSASMQQEIPVNLMEEKSRIDETVEKEITIESDDAEKDTKVEKQVSLDLDDAEEDLEGEKEVSFGSDDGKEYIEVEKQIPLDSDDAEENIEDKRQGLLDSDDAGEDFEDEISKASVKDSMLQPSEAFLPPGCMLPRLLEVPHPFTLHMFVRVLGHCRDYVGILDLVEWMSLFADQVNRVMDESANGKKMMRRCLTAVRVFMERKWIMYEKENARHQGTLASDHRGRIELDAEPAPANMVETVRLIVDDHEEWGGWPSADEMVRYCASSKFI